jgi:pimeloyl-ACP methyl ester carboxylesterase
MRGVRTWTLHRAGVEIAVREYGDPSAPAAVVAHGAGSTGEFVARAFGPALAAAGHRLVAPDLRGHGSSTALHDPALHSTAAHAQDLLAVADRVSASILGGVSLGAHVALRCAAVCAVDGLLLVMPAWTGSGGATAAAHAGWADELAEVGVRRVLERISREPGVPRWVVDELSAAWPRHDPASLVAALRAVAASPGPTRGELTVVSVPAGVVAATDDPAHPLTAARTWADAMPRAVLRTCRLAQVGNDRSVLGALAVAALLSAPR